MANDTLKQRLFTIVKADLQGRASEILMRRIIELISGAGEDLTLLEEAIQKIRISIKLFIDEGLAVSVYDKLHTAALSVRENN